ncbi:nuclear transport factor 2 family protein [Nocardia sp. NPDC051929]|uniref:nuclear transport factor 2 family protein n=1 Tax=Nocardia sp. NPDC051929 TaxID=3364327 RepID=UPI0037C72211
MDRLDVIDTCTRMAWYADLREWDNLAAVFADNVTLDYTSLDGGEPVVLASTQIVAAWQETVGGFAATQHLLGNAQFDFYDQEPQVTVAVDTVAAHFRRAL